MEFRLLGPLEVADDDRSVWLPHGRARSLLALFALHPGELLAADRLIDELWGRSPPPTATTALQGHISTLRKRLEPDRGPGQAASVILTQPHGYVLAVDGEAVDAERFRRSVTTASGLPAPDRAEALRHALSLWRGPALADFTYEPFAQTPITTLEELRLVALEARIGADLALGRHAAVVAELQEMVAAHPLREGLRGHLMLALYRCGRQAEALEVYRDTREYLVDELGIEPCPRLRAIEQAILEQDPSFAATNTDEPPRVSPSRTPSEPATPPRWLLRDRRMVTVVSVDLSLGSLADGRLETDPEAAQLAAARVHAVVGAVIERHGGMLEAPVGDIAVAVFGLPVAHEDDAGRAVRAAVELRRELAGRDDTARDHDTRLAARIGISTGEVVAGHSDEAREATVAFGPPASFAVRLQQQAGAGEVVLDDTTRGLVQSIALLEPLPARGDLPDGWRLIDPVPEQGLPTTDALLVGRDQELTALLAARDHAVSQRRAQLVTVIGEAGIGKSRLARAFAQEMVNDTWVVVGHCRAYGEGITFWPLKEIVRDLVDAEGLEVVDNDVPLVAAAVGLTDDPVAKPAELFAAVRRLFERSARAGPLVVVIEDLHWGQPTLLDLVEYLADTVRAPILIVCLARPELVEQRPRWSQGVASSATIELPPLAAPDSRKLVLGLLQNRLLAPEAMGEILAMGQGNPLFLEQLLAALRDDEQLVIPPTLQALLTARLDRLGPAERDVLRCASVVGVDVHTDALVALVPEEVHPYLPHHLEALSRKDLIHPWANDPSESGFDFAHVLVQQAAYRSLPHAVRAELHERLAERLASAPATAAGESEELVGHHLEQAFHHHRRLGRSDRATAELAIRAGERLAAAGRKAYGRFDVSAAENLLSRARELLPPDHSDRAGVLRPLTEVYPIMGRADHAEEAFAERIALADGDEDELRRIQLEQARFRLITGPDPIPLATIQWETEAALEAFRRAGDTIGVSQAHYVLARVHLRAGRMAQLEEVAWRGVEAARRTGDLREQLGASWWVVFAMLEGPTPVPACIEACEEVLDAGGLTHLGVLAALGHFQAMAGRIEEARGLGVRARELLRERFRVPRPLAFISQQQAAIEHLAEDTDATVGFLREGLEVALQITERESASQIAAELSLQLSEQNELNEAARLAVLAAEQCPEEALAAQTLSRTAAAKVALAEGRIDDAERLGRGTLDHVPDDMLESRARVQLLLAEIVAADGRDQDARKITNDAVDLYRSKGNLVKAQRARRQRPARRRFGHPAG